MAGPHHQVHRAELPVEARPPSMPAPLSLIRLLQVASLPRWRRQSISPSTLTVGALAVALRSARGAKGLSDPTGCRNLGRPR